jgi:raffinose/stachyose/melibiose transport system substrate-binding protein
MKKLIHWAAPLAASLALTLGAGTATAQVTVKWMHIELNPNIANYYKQAVADFEAKNPGVKVQIQVLENEAYKAKLTTLLQSADKPHIIYSWGGGVLQSQVKAGVLQDIDAAVKGDWAAAVSPGAIDAFSVNGRVWGAPMLMSQVGFYYNKALFAKAGVDANAIKTWEQYLAAVKKLKDAGITPIIAGGADKWPLHFYWTHLALRIGGKPAFEAAQKGEAGGFAGDTFVKAGERFKELVALQPFQNGFLASTAPQAYGQFGDGKGAMTLMGNWLYNSQKSNAADKKGLSDDAMGWFAFPAITGGKGDPKETLGGINGWLVTKGAPKEAVDFLKFLTRPEAQREMAANGFFIPVAKGADQGMTNPFLKVNAVNLAASPYHQIFYDQMLGPSVGRVVNDVSTDLAAGSTSPKEAADAIEQARKN